MYVRFILSIMKMCFFSFFFQAEDGIRDAQESRGLFDVYKRQELNIVKARLDGRAFVIGRYYFATLVVDIQSLSSTDAVTLLNNSFIVTTDHALDKLDVPQFALDEGMTIMQMCSNAPIYIAVDGTAIPNEVSSAAAVVVAANTLDIPATLETWGSCVLSAVSYTAFPDSTVALIARENTFGLRVNSSSTLASAIVGGIVVAGTLRTLTVGVSGRDTLQTYNNTIFMAHVGPADFGDFDNQIMPVRLAPLTLASNRPSWWACSNYIRIGQEEDTALNSIPAPKTCLLYTSDAADEEDSVDLGGRRIIKKKKINYNVHTSKQYTTTPINKISRTTKYNEDQK
eukprot:TRINITY_DN45269_c0_g1_i3.p1 TRINITY_DN45269_c0_g1~~TRINITY_DN45269_c0_g1_i3.p1  ORF type:complete len:341 (+),score=56.45 TRINITY_DN45269_c0_g1_i3:30-1052(+)